MPAVRTDDGVKISYKTVGDGPRSLLFMHGWAGSGAYWEEMIKHFDLTGLRAITVDLRGHGDSDKPTTGYTHDRFAKDMFAIADHANAEKVVLVGFSMSARFVQYLACVEPNRVIGQVLIAGCPASEIQLPPETVSAWCNCVGNRDRFKETVVLPFIKVPPKPEVIDRFLDDAIKVPSVTLEETLNMCMKTSFIEKMKGVRKPTLVIGGAYDPIFTPDFLRQAVLPVIQGARLVLVNAAHEIPIEQPEQTAALIQAFLGGLSGI